jgi:Trypsin-co-occurring domain 1
VLATLSETRGWRLVSSTEVVEVSLPDGGLLLVRAERIDGEADGPSDVGLRNFLSFSGVKASLRGIATELHEALQTAKPDVVAVELGFDLAVKGSQILAMVADAGGTASMRVRLEWHNNAYSPADDPPMDNVTTSKS